MPEFAEIEFGEDSAPLYRIAAAEPAAPARPPLEYEFGGRVLLNCRVEEYSKGFALFADFLRDAKKYYKKTCISAPFVYFFSYRPMYRELSHEQLCWYLFWRSRVRGGEYIKTGLSYIFLYIFEQINLSDIIGAEKVYANIIKIWKNYRQEFPRIDKYISEWLVDFALINRISINLDDISEILPDIISTATLPEIYLKEGFFADPDNISLILGSSMPAYNYKKSKFYADKDGEGKHKDVFDYHVAKMLHAALASPAFEKILAAEIEDGVRVKATRESFMGAVCTYNYKRKITVEYKNIWKSFRIREIITNAIRHAENIIREFLQIKSKLNVSGTNFPGELLAAIREYRDGHLAPPAKPKKARADEAPPEELQPFEPDLRVAADIERKSWETTHTLLELQGGAGASESVTSFDDDFTGGGDAFETIDTGEFDQIFGGLDDAPVAPPAESSDMAGLVASLSADELSAVEMLISGGTGADFMRERGVMLEAVIESANGKAMDILGDIIFENGQIIADYAEEIRLSLGEV